MTRTTSAPRTARVISQVSTHARMVGKGNMSDLAEAASRGAFVFDHEPSEDVIDLMVTLAYHGTVLPFRADESRLGFWLANEGGIAHVQSVHPDDRVQIAWTIGSRLLDGDHHVEPLKRDVRSEH